MAKKPLILDFSEYDLDRVIADLEQIRRYNLQRFEMEQLSAVCYEDLERKICAGYRDLARDEFWVRGHMPGMPLMPGVLMCEAAAQLASYFSRKYGLVQELIGFGGLDEVRFRGVVRPGQRLVVVVRLLKIRQAMMTAEFQNFVDRSLVCEGTLKGVPLPVEQLRAEQY